jgi:hypothetical protein
VKRTPRGTDDASRWGRSYRVQRFSSTTGVQLRGPERSEGYVSCNVRVGQRPMSMAPCRDGRIERRPKRTACAAHGFRSGGVSSAEPCDVVNLRSSGDPSTSYSAAPVRI